MKKCLHILPMNKLSGAERMALIMCENMKIYKPIVVCGGENLKNIFKEKNIESYNYSFSNKNILKTIIGLKNIIKKNDITIIHAHDNIASIVAYITKKFFNLQVKVISHIHNCYPWLKENTLNKKIDRIVRPKYDYNIACGKIVLDYYRNNCEYINMKKTYILSNCIDVNSINMLNDIDKISIKNEFNIPKNKKILGCIGRFSEQKGLIPFINEFSKYKDEFKDCVILLVGNGELEEKIKELIIKLDLNEFFVLTGFQEDVYKFYPIIDVFFLPSLYEGLPMVLLEAMAFKKAIVSMNVGSIGEIINNETGVLIEKENYEKFITSIKNLKDNITLKDNYGEKAFNYVKSSFNIDNYVESIEKKYINLEKIV